MFLISKQFFRVLTSKYYVNHDCEIIRIPDEDFFSKRASGASLHTLSKLYDVPVGFVSPLLRQCIAIFAVAEVWLLLDIGWFVLF